MSVRMWRRSVKHLYQRVTRGWDDSVTWDLGLEMAKWMLPRLKRFKEINGGHPPNMTWDEWNAKLEDMIFMFEAVAEDRIDVALKDVRHYKKGYKAFSEYWRDLWW